MQDADVKWYDGKGNKPKLILEVDALPRRDELRYEGSVEEGLWYAEHEDGYVDFFAWDGGQQNGYAGRHFDITTIDGEQITLKGPWSSRAGVMNKHGYGPCLDNWYEVEGHARTSGAVTLETAEEAVDQYLDDVELVEETRFSSEEPYWIPRKI